MREPRTAGGEEAVLTKACPPARVKKRADFLRAAQGQRAQARAFSLQAVCRKDETEPGPPRFGFTVTKKIGGAVLRNRVRRRLKEALRLAPGLSACRGYDYVILARQAVLTQDFAALQEDLMRAVAEVHTRPQAARPRPPRMAKSRRPPPAAPAKTKD